MPQLDPDTALEVLVQLDDELGEVDPATRAIVGLKPAEHGTVALVDVSLLDNGILVAPDDVAGLVVVTTEEVARGEEVLGLHQLLCVLRDGTEVGVYRTLDRGELHTWRTDADPDDAADDLRPRDLASNTARRAFGLASLATPVPMTDLLARAWLLSVAGEALRRFDDEGGPREVGPEELASIAAEPPIGGLHVARDHPQPDAPDAVVDTDVDEGDDDDDGDVTVDDVLAHAPSWEEVHAAAVAGRLELGPFSVDEDHAAWLDPAGFAQVLDQTLPDIEQLLATLNAVGNDDLLGWAIGWLAAREWYLPA